MAATCELRLTRVFAATRSELWAALTEPESLARWLGPVPKGAVPRVVEPGRVLELDWAEPEAPSLVRVELSSVEGRTKLVLDHTRVDARAGMAWLARWERLLGRLEAALEGAAR